MGKLEIAVLSMRMGFVIAVVVFVQLVAVLPSQAIPSNPFVLDASTAIEYGGNTPTSGYFYKEESGSEDGNGAGILNTESSYGGDATVGYYALITWGSNPQPFLTAAYLKAGNSFLYWGSDALAGFNAGSFDALKLIQNGLSNENTITSDDKPKKNDKQTPQTDKTVQFKQISHVQLDGQGTNVPEGGTTMLLLGLGFLGLGLARRRIGCAA